MTEELETASSENPQTDEAQESFVLHLADLTKPMDFDALFGRNAPLEFEIGIGSGYFLTRYCKDNPEVNLFGIDKAGSEVWRTNDKCKRLGIMNARLLRCDAVYFLDDHVANESVQTFHVYYSDPWPKRKHHKHRLWQPKFIQIMERLLKSGGRVYMKTDVSEYFEWIQNAFKESKTTLKLIDDRRLDQEPMEGDYTTNFQQKAIEANHPLHYQVWEKP